MDIWLDRNNQEWSVTMLENINGSIRNINHPNYHKIDIVLVVN